MGALVAGELVEEVGQVQMEVPAAVLVALVSAPAQLVVVPLVVAAAAEVDEDRPEVDVGARTSSYQDLH